MPAFIRDTPIAPLCGLSLQGARRVTHMHTILQIRGSRLFGFQGAEKERKKELLNLIFDVIFIGVYCSRSTADK